MNSFACILQLAFVVPCSSSASPESGLGTSHTSLPGSNGANDQAITTEEMYYEAEPLQPLGTCKALYTFEGEWGESTEWDQTLIGSNIFSYERGKHSDVRGRRTASDWVGSGRWMDEGATGHGSEWLGGGFRTHQLYWEHSFRLNSGCIGVRRQRTTNVICSWLLNFWKASAD